MAAFFDFLEVVTGLVLALSLYTSLLLSLAAFAVLTVHVYLFTTSSQAIPLLASPKDIASSVLRFALERYLGFPPATCSFSKTPVKIPLKDGAVLAADLYQPSAPTKPLGLLLMQTPYGRGAFFAAVFVAPFARRGYSVLMVSTRGTHSSTGTFQPGITAGPDAQETVAWMREQDFFPGAFATYGASYLGMTQWALLDDPPKDCTASAILVGPHDYQSLYWGTGSYPLVDRVSWSYMMGFNEPTWTLRSLVKRLMGMDPVSKVVNSVPVLDGVKEHFGDKTPWLVKTLSTPDVTDPYYKPVLHEKALKRANLPILLIGGWYDLFINQTMQQYRRLRERGVKPVLTVGPWNHSQGSGLSCMRELFGFIEEHVAGRDYKARGRSARIYMTGAEEWKTMGAFPPESQPKNVYLNADLSLEFDEAPESSVGGNGTSSFTFDPSEPTPTIGGTLLMKGGKANDTAFASRQDCLVYTSSALTAPLQIMGRPAISLRHSTSPHPYADLFVRLSEVDHMGQSQNVCDAFRALDPERDQGQETVLELGWCAHQFAAGTKLRVIVAGGSFPQYARNLGVEGNRCVEGEMRDCEHTVEYGLGTKLVLPVVEDE